MNRYEFYKFLKKERPNLIKNKKGEILFRIVNWKDQYEMVECIIEDQKEIKMKTYDYIFLYLNMSPDDYIFSD